jgi:hypothetical protein
MVWPVHEAAFRDLRKLADWFSTSSPRCSTQITRLLTRLGATAIPLLCRELRSAEPRRREAAREALEALAAADAAARDRVTAELHAIMHGAVADEAKVVALGLLSELGEHTAVRFADPAAVRVRAAIALASQLETAADLAGAADLMVHQLDPTDLIKMLEVMADAAPAAAHRLAGELVQRLDISGGVRDRIALLAATIAAKVAPAAAPRRPRAELTHTAVLVDAAARLMVIASRKIAGGRRWRRWAVLIGASGRIEDCLHEEDAGPAGDAAALLASLCNDGYRIASHDLDRAHEVVASAARLTVESALPLPSPYYLGRDLLDLADAHLGGRSRGDAASATLGRAIELIAAGDPTGALALLERCDPDLPEAAAATAAILLAQHRPAAALAPLERALAAEPGWPLHHWNHAAALHALGDERGCYHALRRFVATSATPSGLYGDPEQPARVGRAERMMADLERSARLTGRSLRRRPRPRIQRLKKKRAAPTS